MLPLDPLSCGVDLLLLFLQCGTIIAATSVAIEMIADTQKSAADKQFHHLFRYLGDRRLELRQTETYGNDPTFQAC